MDPPPLANAQWPQVGLVRSYFPSLNGWYGLGSATLINRRAILTAAHVIYDPSQGGTATRFEVFFGGGVQTTAPGGNGFVPDAWKATTNPDPASLSPLSPYDTGVIVLDAAQAVDGVPTAGVCSSSFTDLNGHFVNFVGYPVRADYNGGLAGGQCQPLDMGTPLNEYRVAYVIESLPGMSGGPVYRTDEVSGQKIFIRAVNTSVYNGMGNGLIIYPALAAQIGQWLGQVV